MATYDMATNNTSKPFNAYERNFVLETTLDLADLGAAGADTDIINVINIPAGTKVLDVVVEVLEAEGAAGSITIGDGADPDGFLTASSINSLAILNTTAAAFTTLGGKLYTSADTLDVVLAGAVTYDSARILIRAYCRDENKKGTQS